MPTLRNRRRPDIFHHRLESHHVTNVYVSHAANVGFLVISSVLRKNTRS